MQHPKPLKNKSGRDVNKSAFDNFFNFRLIILLLVSTFFTVSASAATTTMKHTPPDYFVADQRIQLETQVKDDQGVKLVRCYFKAAGEADLVFVPMVATGSDAYTGILPAPSTATTQIEYLFLAVNQSNQVVRSQNFFIYKDANQKTPAWQNIPKEGEIRVSIELDKAPTQLMGFSDNVTIDVVESSARFGVVALLYHAVTDSNDKSAGLGASSESVASAASTTSVASAASATGATSAGVITAGALGWSTAAIVGVGIGVAAVAGGTAAAVSGGGGGGGGGGNDGEPQDLTEKTIEGDWNVNGSSIYNWTTFGNITFNGNGTYSYSLRDKAPDQPPSDSSGTGTWTLVGSNLTLTFDAGAVYNGTATGDSNSFRMVSDNGWTLNFIR
ncbi:MAG: hypothetical protein C4518_18955 [Desulfobacteraceae bacterium]|nr:MAG: hypothetical protein C4518_18955 [Desulfobacteraceae bacterium]